MVNRYTNEVLTGREAAKFINADGHVVGIPIVYGALNTDYLPKFDDLAIIKFSAGLVISVRAICSYGVIKHNVVNPINTKGLADEMMGISSMINPVGVTACLSFLVDAMAQRDKAKDNVLEYNLSGSALSHEAYIALVWVSAYDPRSLSKWLQLVNLAIRSEKKFLVMERKEKGAKFSINFVGVRLPSTIKRNPIDIKSRETTLGVAFDANVIARTIRGENDREVAVNSRIANLPFQVTYAMGEDVRAQGNYARYWKDFTDVLIKTTQRGGVRATVEILNAMVMDGYTGKVAVNMTLQNIAGMKVTVVDGVKTSVINYREGEFNVEFYNSDQLVADYFGEGTLVIDLDNIISNTSKFIDMSSDYERDVPLRIKLLDTYGCKWVFPVKMYPGIDKVLLINEDGVVRRKNHVRSGVQVSNLEVLVSNFFVPPITSIKYVNAAKFPVVEGNTFIRPVSRDSVRRLTLDEEETGDGRWYEIRPINFIQDLDLGHISDRNMWNMCVVLFNIARCTHNITGRSPNNLLMTKGLPPVRNTMSGLARIGSLIRSQEVIDTLEYNDLDMDDLMEQLSMSTSIVKSAAIARVIRTLEDKGKMKEDEFIVPAIEEKGEEEDGEGTGYADGADNSLVN